MQFFVKIITSILFFSIASCSFLNSETVIVTIDSDPTGAKIYVDDIYYGDTVKEISLIPDRNHYLRLQKDGYQAVVVEMETAFLLRKYDRRRDYARCRLDRLGSIFVFPIFGLKSLYCRDFTKKLYSFELVPAINFFSNNPMTENKIPFRPYGQIHQPPQFDNQKVDQKNTSPNPASDFKNANPEDNSDSSQNDLPTSRPIFNNQSEFVNDGNESTTANQNFNNKTRVDYYNWR